MKSIKTTILTLDKIGRLRCGLLAKLRNVNSIVDFSPGRLHVPLFFDIAQAWNAESIKHWSLFQKGFVLIALVDEIGGIFTIPRGLAHSLE